MSRFCGIALLALVTWSTSAQIVYPEDGLCRTPDNKYGVCINLKTCPNLLEKIQKKHLEDQDIKFLQESKCGFEGRDPKVCCETGNTQEPAVDDTQVPEVTYHPNLRLLDQNRCGPMGGDRILNGNISGLTEFPWMALLAYDVGRRKPEFRCGGTVINNRYVLTAAHCVTSLPSNLRLQGVRVGEHDISTERDCEIREGVETCNERYQDFGVESVIYHPEFSLKTLHDDIALIRLDRNVDFRPNNAKPICLPIASAAKIRSKKLVVTGWGVTEQHVSSPVMLKLKVPIFPLNECAAVYKKNTQIWHKQICAGGEVDKDSCGGDSGGPLQGVGPRPSFVQYGIVSFGNRICGVGGFPGVYTRVDYYVDWILDNMRD